MAGKGALTKDFLAIVHRIETDIQALLEKYETHDALMEKISESAVRNVYDTYEPTLYERRGVDGVGIADTYNYEVDTGKMSLRLLNNTKGNLKYKDTEGWDSGYITDIIESGNGYHWTQSEIFKSKQARPFMEEGLEDFIAGYLEPKLDEMLK